MTRPRFSSQDYLATDYGLARPVPRPQLPENALSSDLISKLPAVKAAEASAPAAGNVPFAQVATALVPSHLLPAAQTVHVSHAAWPALAAYSVTPSHATHVLVLVSVVLPAYPTIHSHTAWPFSCGFPQRY